MAKLRIEGPGVQVRPSFDPRIMRYAVYPTGNGDPLFLTASVDNPNLPIAVDGRAVPSGRRVPIQDPHPGRLISVQVGRPAGPVASYRVLVLPSNFPIMDVSTLDPSAVGRGPLYLAVNSDRHSCLPPQACWVMTVDHYGVPLYYLREDRWVSDFKLQPTGQRSYQVILGAGAAPPAAAVILDPPFRNTDPTEETASGFSDGTNAHDFLIRPGGSRVFLAYLGPAAQRPEAGGSPLVEGVVQVQDARGEVTFRWDSSEELSPATSSRDNSDYLHLNSVVVAQNRDLLVSARGTSQVYRIDRATGRLDWTLGGDNGDFRFISDPYDGMCGQHSAVFLPNGNILVFDNGQTVPTRQRGLTDDPVCPAAVETSGRGRISRAVEYRLDKSRGTARMVWNYEQGTYAPSQGSVQRLPNGDTLIGWGINTSGLLATEVDADGRKVFQISGIWPDGSAATSYRAYRFAR